ncbi:potassium channel family protein [uncultured Duncaniella sp.]|uniref:potassium channel family protein n=1 Tax=uncultured Duncaniella sp. TaxID=2768039 RepID=UPI0025ADFA06|nr:potassium channel family protein [uncultured Duncaniella sp.]
MSSANTVPATVPERPRRPRIIEVMNLIVLILSVLLIVFISVDTFKNFLENHSYMVFQLWVCIFFIADFFMELTYSDKKWSFVRRRLAFLLLSIPYLNIINLTGMHLSGDVLYFVRFIPLARGALAMSIVIGYLSSNAVTSLFMSYIVILLMITYFCSLIFYAMEQPVNYQVTTYWSALWWALMNMSTVGCDISPVTVAGKIVAVILPIAGMIVFPLFTVYLTNFLTGYVKGMAEK